MKKLNKAAFCGGFERLVLTTENNIGIPEEDAKKKIKYINKLLDGYFTENQRVRPELRHSAETEYLAPYAGDSCHAFEWGIQALVKEELHDELKAHLEKNGFRVVYRAV